MGEQAYGREFFNEGIRQLDGVMVGRPDAKIAAMVILTAGVNGVFAGGTGRFKTELAEGMSRLVHDIYDENVAAVPIQNDLSGLQLIGGSSSFTREIRAGEDTTTEVTTTDLAGVLKEDTQVLIIDELNRVPVKALNSLLPALETRKVSTLDGERQLPNLEYVIATLNPRETYEATNPVSHAGISRFSVGAIFGRGADKNARIEAVVEIGDLPKESKIEPITDLGTIHAMREAAKDIDISKSLDRRVAEASVEMSDALWDNTSIRLDDGEERLSKQVRKIARIVAVLSSEKQVTEEGVSAAIKLVMAARIGMAAKDAVEIGPQLLDDVVQASFH